MKGLEALRSLDDVQVGLSVGVLIAVSVAVTKTSCLVHAIGNPCGAVGTEGGTLIDDGLDDVRTLTDTSEGNRLVDNIYGVPPNGLHIIALATVVVAMVIEVHFRRSIAARHLHREIVRARLHAEITRDRLLGGSCSRDVVADDAVLTIVEGGGTTLVSCRTMVNLKNNRLRDSLGRKNTITLFYGIRPHAA